MTSVQFRLRSAWMVVSALLLLLLASCIQVVVRAEDYVHPPLQYESRGAPNGPNRGEYNFGWDTGLYGAHAFHQERKQGDGSVRGRYGYTDPTGTLRLVNYKAGAGGYQAWEGDQPEPPASRAVSLLSSGSSGSGRTSPVARGRLLSKQHVDQEVGSPPVQLVQRVQTPLPVQQHVHDEHVHVKVRQPVVSSVKSVNGLHVDVVRPAPHHHHSHSHAVKSPVVLPVQQVQAVHHHDAQRPHHVDVVSVPVQAPHQHVQQVQHVDVVKAPPVPVKVPVQHVDVHTDTVQQVQQVHHHDVAVKTPPVVQQVHSELVGVKSPPLAVAVKSHHAVTPLRYRAGFAPQPGSRRCTCY